MEQHKTNHAQESKECREILSFQINTLKATEGLTDAEKRDRVSSLLPDVACLSGLQREGCLKEISDAFPMIGYRALKCEFGKVCAATDVSFDIEEGESIGVVGESGSGKTQVFLSVMGLLAKNGRAGGSIRYRGTELLDLPTRELNRIRGVHLSMIFQDPMTSLNPLLKISRQMTEVLIEHKGASTAQARRQGIEMLVQQRA